MGPSTGVPSQTDARRGRHVALRTPSDAAGAAGADDSGSGAAVRVLLLNTLYAPHDSGGAARSVGELARDLADRGIEVRVVTLAPADDERAEAAGGVQVVRLVDAPAFAPFGPEGRLGPVRKASWHLVENRRRRTTERLRRLVAEFEPDVVHTHNIAGFGIGAWTAVPAATPLVHTMRDYYLLCARSQLFRDGVECGGVCTECRMLKSGVRRAVRRPDVFIGVSAAVVDRHRRLGAIAPDERSAVVLNRPRIADPPPRTRSAVLRFGLLGKAGADKGTRVALDAFRALPSDLVARAELRIAGPADDVERAAIAAAAASGVRVVHEDGRVDPAAFYAGVDVVLVPSQWQEPFGRVAAEARIAGLPVITSRAGGLPEALDAVGGGVLIDDYTSPAAWTAVLAACIVDPPAVGRAGRWTGPGVAEQYLERYSEAASMLPGRAKAETDGGTGS